MKGEPPIAMFSQGLIMKKWSSQDNAMYAQNRSFQEVTVSDFFNEANPDSPF